MDRVISLLAALVGLIALAGAVLVGTNGDLARRQLATDIAELKTGMALATQKGASDPVAAALPSAETDAAATIAALSARIDQLEAMVSSQAALLATGSSVALASAPPVAPVPSSAPTAPGEENTVTPLIPSVLPSQSETAAALTPDGPTKDCIPLGTRFMAKAGDAFPICRTKVVITLASVDDGSATLSGTGPVAAGAATMLPVAGCQAMVLSADLSGYAELRVTCQ